MSEEKKDFLKIEDLEVIYTAGKKTVQAVNHVSFELKKGETLALVGETGAGKTTIAKAILRILPDPPAKMLGGKIWLDGEELTTMSEDEMRDIRGGKIAMALACNPLLLLADEPTTALDVTIQAQVLDLIRELKDRQGTSMILITHDLGVVAETSDQVAVVYAREIIEYSSKRDLFLHPLHPYTNGLFDSLPDMAGDGKKLKPIAGFPPDPTDLPKGCAFAPRCPRASERCRSGRIPMTEVRPGHFCRCCDLK